MSVLPDLLVAVPPMALIGLGVGLVAVVGRDRDRQHDQHDVSDYRPKPTDTALVDEQRPGLAPARRAWPLVDVDDTTQNRRWLRHEAMTDLGLPPVPTGTSVHLTLYAEQVVVELMRARYGTTSSEVIAGRFLRELGERVRAQLVVASR